MSGSTEAEIEAAAVTTALILEITAPVNTFYLLFAGTLVFFMQVGFAMLCAGSVRQKNVKNIMLKNLLDACGGAIGFFVCGYAFAQGGGGNKFIGSEGRWFFLQDVSLGADYISWFFQFAFAATAATIVAGTVAERCKMEAYLCYSFMLSAFVYPVVNHSIWNGDGFLSCAADPRPIFDIGMIDFAGSGVVHMTGGCTALIAAIILGPRQGRFHDSDGNVLPEPATFAAHSVSLQVLGTFILWVGWYGFNPGSTLGIIDGTGAYADQAGLCAITTTLAASMGCVSALFTDTILGIVKTGEAEYDLTFAMNGALSGLVAITAGCSVVTPWAACVIGLIGGWVYVGASKLLITLKIDDAVDAIPVHFFNGMWGCLAVGLFAEPNRTLSVYADFKHFGWFYSWGRNSGDFQLFIVQFIGILWIIGWVVATMAPFFFILNFLGMFRVDALEEEVGLDISHHRGAAYDMTGPSKEDIDELVARRATAHGKVEVPVEVTETIEQADNV
eukprot:CAMPEP_0197827126 /NCGR_PEP_ID=MMETSP1437-20131217/3985_1 /TAXON_ID=49252 ORGANISM="Eucampia antarctica, Strain CCMP1452" /NCGR_SAMPLE_ID=MMETSP1437 /ASSEMBLY_ACC=CAM_ASM_001096 /LENGTH=501 /DNA_ID=CAMNT_0043427863 /DNA_START=119 /DNA_END=1624 /DNA_ORIENTATION=-